MPAYVLGTFVCYMIVRRGIPPMLVLIITGIITCIWYIFFRDNPEIISDQFLYMMGDKRLYGYLFFFVTGFCLRNGLINFRPQPIPLLFIIVSSFILVALCIENAKSDLLAVLPYLFFNLSLALYVLYYVAPLNIFQNKFLAFVNKQSLGIYLFHPMIMMCIYYILGDPDKKYITMTQGTLVSFATIFLVTILVIILKKSKFLNRNMLGNINE